MAAEKEVAEQAAAEKAAAEREEKAAAAGAAVRIFLPLLLSFFNFEIPNGKFRVEKPPRNPQRK